ncbi:MAG: hypothetical protein WC755_09840, partial [Candidatus Woesearchaeota archaeon]
MPEYIKLKLIDINKEELTGNQIDFATEYNTTIKDVEASQKNSLDSSSHFDIVKDLQKMTGYRQRIGAIIPHLRYECKKQTSVIENIYRTEWKKNHLVGLNATACNKLAEAEAYTLDREKNLRIAEWLLEIFEKAFETIQGIIHS